jgi:uncharacterized protein (DUF1778 family)
MIPDDSSFVATIVPAKKRQVTFRVTDDQHKLVMEACNKAGLSVRQFVLLAATTFLENREGGIRRWR